jgi:hypothetical protein
VGSADWARESRIRRAPRTAIQRNSTVTNTRCSSPFHEPATPVRKQNQQHETQYPGGERVGTQVAPRLVAAEGAGEYQWCGHKGEEHHEAGKVVGGVMPRHVSRVDAVGARV